MSESQNREISQLTDYSDDYISSSLLEEGSGRHTLTGCSTQMANHTPQRTQINVLIGDAAELSYRV